MNEELNKKINEKINQGLSDLKLLSLSTTQKQALLSSLEQYADLHSVSETSSVPSPFWHKYTVWQPFVGSHSRPFAYALLALVIITGSGGILAASNNALPGEILYAIKINVSEPLQGVAATDSISKVKWEAEKIDRRLEEVEILAAQGKLDSETSAKLQSQININTEAVNKAVLAEKTKNVSTEATAVQLDLESQREAHDRILGTLENHLNSTEKKEVAKFRSQSNVSSKSTFSAVSAPTTIRAAASFRTEEVKSDVKVARPEDQEKILQVYSAPSNQKSQTKDSDTKATSTSSALESEFKKIEVLIKDTEDAMVKVSDDSNDLQKDIWQNAKSDLTEAKNLLEIARSQKVSGDREVSSTLSIARRKANEAATSFKAGIKLGREAQSIQIRNSMQENDAADNSSRP